MDLKFTHVGWPEWLSPKWLRFPKVLRPGSGRDEVLGLDIGSSAVKMVALRKDSSGYTVDAAAIAEIEYSDDNNQRKINTISAIHECLKSAGTKRKLAVCGISGPEVAVRDFEFPLLDTEEISGAVRLEASQVCPFNIDDGSVDYQLFSDLQAEISEDQGEKKTKGVLVAATNKLINSKVQFAKEAHLKCVLMDVDGLALLNCFNKLAEKDLRIEGPSTRLGSTVFDPECSDRRELAEVRMGATAILNAGASNMSIAVMGANGRPFIRDMAYAGNDIIEQIATEKNIPTESVKEMLFGNSQAAEVELNHCLEKACRKVIDDVAETLRFYSAQVKSTTVDRIFVCGGFALAAGFVELLSSQLGIEAVFWNPFEKLRCDIPKSGSARLSSTLSAQTEGSSPKSGQDNRQYQDFFTKNGSVMAVAAGLAMRSI